MSRNIKIELELPEFEKELNISVTLRKDGEVLECTSSTPTGVKTDIHPQEAGQGWKQQMPGNTPQNLSMGGGPGNLMNVNF